MTIEVLFALCIISYALGFYFGFISGKENKRR
jgi:hypothetical protein